MVNKIIIMIFNEFTIIDKGGMYECQKNNKKLTRPQKESIKAKGTFIQKSYTNNLINFFQLFGGALHFSPACPRIFFVEK